MMCDRGRIETKRLPPAGMVWRQRIVDASSIVCVMVTPLGFPVEPDVHRISTGASGSAGVAGGERGEGLGRRRVGEVVEVDHGQRREARDRDRLHGAAGAQEDRRRLGEGGDPVDRVRGHPDVERDEHDVRATGREQRRREPGPGRALDQDPGAGRDRRGQPGCRVRRRPRRTRPSSSRTSRVLDVRTPRKWRVAGAGDGLVEQLGQGARKRDRGGDGHVRGLSGGARRDLGGTVRGSQGGAPVAGA